MLQIAALAAVGISFAAHAEGLEDLPPKQVDGAGSSGSGPTTDGPRVNVQGVRGPEHVSYGLTGLGSTRNIDRGTTRQLNQGGREKPTDPRANDKKCPKPGNPIVAVNGNKIETEQDFAAAGEAALQFRRTYNQQWDGVGLFGYKWLSSFDYRLSFGGSYPLGPTGTCYARPSIPACTLTTAWTEIWAHQPDGRKIRYIKGADGAYYEDKPSPISKITRQANGTWLLVGEENDVELYTAGGYPISIKNERGIGWTFTHGGLNGTQLQRVTHTSGRYADLVWTEDELTGVRDPASNLYAYTYGHQKAYDGLHLLKSTALPGSPATTISYHYADETGEASYGGYGLLTGKSVNGSRYSTFTYAGGKGASTEHANGVEKYTFTYATDTNGGTITTVVNPLGKSSIYYFDANDNLTEIIGQASANCPQSGRGLTYDANGYPDVVTDFNGNATNFDYNAKGQLLKKVEGSGSPQARTTNYVWDTARNRIVTTTVETDSEASYTFSTDNRLASVSVKNISAKGVPGQTLTTTHAYTKHPNGMLASTTIDGPLPGTGDAATYAYDQYGNLTSVTNSLGYATTYSNYNLLGQPGRVTDPNGDITEYVYDARGRVTQEKRWINSTWQTTVNSYDSFGRIASIQRPDGQTRNFVYDAAWRLAREYEQESAGVFAQKRYTYNNASLVTRIDTERTTSPTATPVLSAPATNANGTYTVSWNTTADTTGYRLEENMNGGTWAEVQNSSAVSRAISGKANGTYGYRVRACNAAGCGAYSSAVSVVVSLSGPPATPTMTAPPSYNSSGYYSASWGSVPGATSYRLEESRDAGAWSQIYSGTATSFALTKGMSADFSYRVRACNSYGCSTYSATRTVSVEVESCPSCFLMTEPEQMQIAPTEHGGEGV